MGFIFVDGVGMNLGRKGETIIVILFISDPNAV